MLQLLIGQISNKPFNYRFIVCNENALNCTGKMFEGKVLGDVAFVHELTKKYFNNLNVPHHRLEYTKDRVYMISPIFYFEKNSKLRNPFNRHIRLYDQSGLISYWVRQFTDDKKIEQKYKQKIIPKLKFRNITGVLEICGGLYLFSVIVFILEIYSRRFKFVQCIIDFFTY